MPPYDNFRSLSGYSKIIIRGLKLFQATKESEGPILRATLCCGRLGISFIFPLFQFYQGFR